MWFFELEMCSFVLRPDDEVQWGVAQRPGDVFVPGPYTFANLIRSVWCGYNNFCLKESPLSPAYAYVTSVFQNDWGNSAVTLLINALCLKSDEQVFYIGVSTYYV